MEPSRTAQAAPTANKKAMIWTGFGSTPRPDRTWVQMEKPSTNSTATQANGPARRWARCCTAPVVFRLR